MRFAVIILSAIWLSSNHAVAQKYEVVPKREMLDKANQIGAAIDMAYAVKSATEQFYKGREISIYRLVSKRLMGCALLYGVLSKSTGSDQLQGQLYSAASSVFSAASAYLSPDGVAAYKDLYAEVQSELVDLRKTEDKKKQLYYLRNCKDFSQPATIVSAIQELVVR